MNVVSRLLKAQDGATAIEYAIILASVAIAGFLTYDALGSVTLDMFKRTLEAFPSS
ncbi:MAG: Flp family type IVb pilin [Rhodospirillales bacterium]|jgi:Flp pilus assembly pilin Flp|nr:Flp family type IVb pilin [Rhodospirillales bacterium]